MYEFYRQSIIGKALQDTIDEKVSRNQITPLQAKTILERFDACIPTVFNRTVQSTVNFKGGVGSYNFVDGVWRFSTRNFVMTINNELVRTENVKIVACDADTSLDSGRRRRRKADTG
ncbi:subunit gamma of transcription initiation factor IIA [Hamiltosporidium tvaerminnensis]|uniref:Transcription initiation factor IIA subunit 2 n=2 Tax=Hamiltosporidium TaxID=1176354 RepID=A0A4Q9KQ76_9MICR|nr:Transcription initiation factor IIA subunit [Hamiltosporidium tvaerminnensis]TBT96778.1 subunit gamma of transcription initiation factor IIA [Hamiltosporidium magnivora]TBU01572.1 subunit gamma of transcription initiation factor IIA [Hamiltosporidium magnivora]TBU02960.1 subunit gamma of transcription initiation factor IIA [Hamiltosporidium tvaerminnensis]TBU20503.1 subunit gamma of transcription initiation factor IIA [Hamiltosporidium tvaerminnensis]